MAGGNPMLPEGSLLEPGNIDLTHRPVHFNEDGSYSTLYSMSFSDKKGREVLIPTVRSDGKMMTPNEAMREYGKTGKHLGIFRTPEAADLWAQHLHNELAARYGSKGSADLETPGSGARDLGRGRAARPMTTEELMGRGRQEGAQPSPLQRPMTAPELGGPPVPGAPPVRPLRPMTAQEINAPSPFSRFGAGGGGLPTPMPDWRVRPFGGDVTKEDHPNLPGWPSVPTLPPTESPNARVVEPFQGRDVGPPMAKGEEMGPAAPQLQQQLAQRFIQAYRQSGTNDRATIAGTLANRTGVPVEHMSRFFEFLFAKPEKEQADILSHFLTIVVPQRSL